MNCQRADHAQLASRQPVQNSLARGVGGDPREFTREAACRVPELQRGLLLPAIVSCDEFAADR